MRQFLSRSLTALAVACLGLLVGATAGFWLCGLFVPLDPDPVAPPGSGFALMLWSAAGAAIGTVVGLAVGIIVPSARRRRRAVAIAGRDTGVWPPPTGPARPAV